MAKEKRRARRGRGEGSVFQRGDGRWTASVTIGVNANGRRVRKTVYGATKKEAQDKLSRLQGQKLDGTIASLEKITLAAFMDRWLEDTARPRVSHATYVCYEGTIRLHLSPKIGGLRLSVVTAAHVQGLYSALEREGASSHVQRLCHAVLRRAFKTAIKQGKLTRNIFDAVDAPPRAAKRDIQPLTGEQVAKLFKTARGGRLEAIYAVAIGTGMRLGELFGLHWADVDLDAGIIFVRQALSEAGKKLALKETKTAMSRRRIELPAIAVDALHDHRKRMLAEGHAGAGYVFCSRAGGPIRRSNFHRQQFKPLLNKAGLPAIRFHDLRHSHASLLLLGGAHPKVVQERLGHSQISMTMDVYSHLLPGIQREAANNFNDMLVADAAKLKASEKAQKRAAKKNAAALAV